MKRAISILLLILLGGAPAAAQIPAEWRSAAQAVVGELERDTPQAAKQWSGAELTQGWNLARAWRRHNNGNIEIILAEYLMFVALCRRGCANSTIEGQGYVGVAEQAKALRNQNGGAYAMASNAHAWLAALPDPSGAAQKNAALWDKDPNLASADFATRTLYALAWLLARMLDKSPAAVRRGLYTMKKVEAMAFEESMAFTESQIALFTLTDDAREGQKAFQEKRKPVWAGQ